MAETTPAYGRVPAEIIDAGVLSRIKGRPIALLVYVVLCRHVGRDWTAWPSAETIADRHNLDVRSVRRGFADLRRAGLIEVVNQGGGRGRATVHRLVLNPDTGVTVSGAVNPDTAVRETLTAGAETLTPGALNSDTGVTPTEHGTEHGTEHSQQTRALPAAAVGEAGLGQFSESEAAADRALFEAGVRNPARTELVRAGRTAAEVEQAMDYVAEQNVANPAGLLIRLLQSSEPTPETVAARTKRELRAWLDEPEDLDAPGAVEAPTPKPDPAEDNPDAWHADDDDQPEPPPTPARAPAPPAPEPAPPQDEPLTVAEKQAIAERVGLRIRRAE